MEQPSRSTHRGDGAQVDVVIEIPRGSRNKFECDPDLDNVVVVRTLPDGMRYPFDYGFVPETKSEDGDPLDAVVLGDRPWPPRTRLTARLLGILWMTDEQRGDPKLLTSPPDERGGSGWVDLGDVPDSLRRDMVRFFSTYKRREPGADVEITGFGGVDAAMVELERARARFIGDTLESLEFDRSEGAP